MFEHGGSISALAHVRALILSNVLSRSINTMYKDCHA